MEASAAPFPAHPAVGLVLTGGGARAAYQVGVLQALARMARASGAPAASPFQVITGTSAGALNAAALACQGDDFQRAVQALLDVWANFEVEQVYRADSLGLISHGAPWLVMLSMGWAIARWRKLKPRSLLDNSPLESLLHRMVPFERLPSVMAAGHVHALAVSGSSYTTGQHVTFYESDDALPPWTRSQRVAVRGALGVRHLLASSAIPFVFPAVSLPVEGEPEWFGDGSMRQAAPISPAVHLGAERIFIVGAGRMHEPPGRRVQANGNGGYPSVAQIAGHALSNIFLDALAVDIERMQRINTTLSLLPPEARAATPLRPIQTLVISPSQRLDDIAGEHLGALPLTIRTLLHGLGVNKRKRASSASRGSALASYLLFEAPYTRALIALGEADTEARRDEVEAFFGWSRPQVSAQGGATRAGSLAEPATAGS
jgi:NTE family protein